MSKITDLEKISGDKTKAGDLFVMVSLDEGEDGTKSITRDELLKALQQEQFTDIQVAGGLIDNTPIKNPNITVTRPLTDNVQGDDYFYLKDVSAGTTVAFSYSKLYGEIAKSSEKAFKVYVSPDGNDSNVGSYLAPVATLDRAVTIAQEKAKTIRPGVLDRQIINITVGPGTYYTNGELALPDFCSMIGSSGQYSTTIVMNDGYETNNCILLGSGCYVQGFSFFNLKVDNFDYPTSGFAFAFRPGAKITRSPYVRDSSQISNYFEKEIPALLNPVNSRGTIYDLGYELTVSGVTGTFKEGDSITTSDDVNGFVSRVDEIGSGTIYIRNNTKSFAPSTTIASSSGGSATITTVGEEDFPNKNVGRGGGMVIADREVLDTDSIFPYMLCFGATPRTQNGIGYVAKNGAGINGISSLSIFARCAFYALNGGQITLNNSGTQFGDISMRSKGSTPIFDPRQTTATLVANNTLADTIMASSDTVIDDLWSHLTTTLGYEGYNSTKCKRDTGYILDGVGNDLTLGTNYWAVLNGNSYRTANSQVVIDDQLTETSGAISFLKSSVKDLLQNAANETRTDAAFDEIIDILENGSSNADALTFSSTGISNHANAKDLLIANKSLIQTDLITWVNTNYPSLVYNVATYTRNIGYKIDALTHDLNYETNIASILNAEERFKDTAPTPASVTGTIQNPTNVNTTIVINGLRMDVAGADLDAVVQEFNTFWFAPKPYWYEGIDLAGKGFTASNAGGFLKIEKATGSFTITEYINPIGGTTYPEWITQLGMSYGTFDPSSVNHAVYEQLGKICSSIVLGTYASQDTASGAASQVEASKCIALANMLKDVIKYNSLTHLQAREEPDLTWVATNYVNGKEIIDRNKAQLQKTTVAYVNATYDFIDEALTRRDALNFLRSITNDFRGGTQTGARIFTASLFTNKGKHVFSVFNPTTVGLNYIGSVATIGDLPAGSTVAIKDAYIVYTSVANVYDGTVHYWNGSAWISDGANDISLLNAFTNSWDRMRATIKSTFTLTAGEEAMLDGLIDEVLTASVRNPVVVNFGSLVESLSHQFNLASAGVNVNALPINMRRLGQPISAAASVLEEDGGRIRWSGADELNNQYFAKGLRINGRTGRIEGRPFTSSVRKLARRAANSRTST
jgi:hypothetical protein